MDSGTITKAMFEAITDFEREKALESAQKAIDLDLDLITFIQQSMTTAMDSIGRKFEQGELFLPHLVMAGNIFQAAMDILQPRLIETASSLKPAGRVVIGTVKGDVHAIGKNLVAIMLKTGGFDVIDLGVDVPVLTFLDTAQKVDANIIALSALLSTTLPVQQEVVTALSERGLRPRFKVMIGGAVTSQEFADRIGADGYGRNAMEAVTVARRLCA